MLTAATARVSGHVLLAIALCANAHDDLSSRDIAALSRVVDRLRELTQDGELSAEEACGFDFEGFTSHDLEHIPSARLDRDVPNDLRAALSRVARTAIHRRSAIKHLSRGDAIAFHLSATEPAEWGRAFRLLRREPFSEHLDRVAVSLADDERPAVRLMAGRLAKSLVIFGRDAPSLVGAVLGCVTDRDPNVAAAFAMHDALDCGRVSVVDRLVGSLGDGRALAREPTPLLAVPGYATPGDVATYVLSRMKSAEEFGRQPRPGPATTRNEDDLARRLADDERIGVCTPEDIRDWWKANKSVFGFGLPASRWTCALDQVLVVEVGKPEAVTIDGIGCAHLTLMLYQEEWVKDRPVTTVHLELRSMTGDHLAACGVRRHVDGFVTRGTCASQAQSELALTCAVMPTGTEGKVRVKARVHVARANG